MTFKKSKLATAALIAISSMGSASAWAQDAQRVEITGSAIKRIDAETAVPVTVLSVEELRQQGVTTVEQIVSNIVANQSFTGSSQQVGSGSGGASFADLRGIGASKTLVLLNGRRIANNAIDGSAPDLNMIPFAALDRVEILRDGASSLYGTDAIGGVINFITRKSFKGGSIILGADRPSRSGGESAQANIGFGIGDYADDGFNIFGFVDFNKTDRIKGTQRPFNERFPGGLSPTPFPANYFQSGDVVGNPAAPDCNNPSFLVPSGDGTSCLISTSKFVDYTPETERRSAFLRGVARLGNDHNLSLEWFGTRNESTAQIAPVPYGRLWMNPYLEDGVSPNPYFPGNGNFTPTFPIDPTFPAVLTPIGDMTQDGFVFVRWRALAGGSRTDITTNKQQRVVAELDGVISEWDYRTAISYNENKISQDVAGYTDGNKIVRGVLNGIINPFGEQSSEGASFINDALLDGNLQNHRGKVYGWDGQATRELSDWLGAGKAAAVALGAEYRREDFWSASNKPVAERLVSSTGVDPDFVAEGDRSVAALYAELSLPITKDLELTAAVRYDDYSDFGSSTNPKVTLRYQPSSALLVRGSYSTGFRAPSLYELYSSTYYTNTGTVNDPVNCPGGNAVPGKSPTLNCNVQFQALYGGNVDLEPETSKNFTLGLVFEPSANLSVGVDFWWIRLRDVIGSLSFNTVLSDVDTFGRYISRNSSGDLSTDGFACPGSDCGYLDLRTQNLGGVNTNGIDLSAAYRYSFGSMGRLTLGLNSTYVASYEYQDFAGGPWNQNVGVYVGSGPVFRWQHAATAMWNMNSWTVGLAGRMKSGYVDQDPSNKVSQYATLDAYVGWASPNGIDITFGIRNLTDRDPPYSNQDEVFQANYDPRFTDPTGRTFFLRAGYRF